MVKTNTIQRLLDDEDDGIIVAIGVCVTLPHRQQATVAMPHEYRRSPVNVRTVLFVVLMVLT